MPINPTGSSLRLQTREGNHAARGLLRALPAVPQGPERSLQPLPAQTDLFDSDRNSACSQGPDTSNVDRAGVHVTRQGDLSRDLWTYKSWEATPPSCCLPTERPRQLMHGF